ncbi:MAG: type II toxin-antitoxin system HipA family toxin, partial [Lysobacter sp.]
MVKPFPTCEVALWGEPVGYLADTGRGQIAFEYSDAFLRGGLEISPIKMPLRAGQVYVNADDPQAFDGLPGVFADSLPDLYGKKVVRKYFEDKYPGRNSFTSIVQHLMYIGSRGIGALEYLPAEETGLSSRESLEVAYLVEQARRVVQGDINTHIGAIMQSYATAGGQRPKAVIGWNRQTNEIRAGIPPIPDGFENWIIKFDGAEAEPQDYGRIEHAYARMAASAGITVPATDLIVENGRAHFLTRRFDNNDGQRLHMHSLGGLMHADYNKPRLVDYTEFLAVVMALTKDHSQVTEGFRRMAFNVIARNQDDHVKN